MLYLSQLLGRPVIDAAGEEIGMINDIAIVTGEVFPRVTSLAFLGPDKTPFMLSWRKFVGAFDGESVTLNVPASELRFSYLQPDEVLLHRDLLNKQIVDTQGMKVVRVNDLKLSESRNQLRLLGAEVGMRGLFRSISPAVERAVETLARLVGSKLPENLIAWNYMDLLDRDLSQVKLSVTHKRLHELHPADVADILEQLSPSQRAAVFAHLDNEAAAETISELEDAFQADVIDDLSERRASDLLAVMDPDDAADIIGDLPYEKAERLLRLMGLEDSGAIRTLLGYREKTAGGIMTPEVTTVTDEMTIAEVIEHLREYAAEHETVYYVYVVGDDGALEGVISLRDLLLASPGTTVGDLAERDLFTANPDDDQEDVAEQMSKYDLLAMPVVDERGKLLGIVTVDDALEVLEEEAEEDLAIAMGSTHDRGAAASLWGRVWRRSIWVAFWAVALVGSISFAATGQTRATVIAWAAILLPLLLRTAEESSSRAVAEIIEGDDENRPPLTRRLATEAAVGALLGLSVGVAAGAFAFVLQDSVDPVTVAVEFGLMTAVSVMATVVFGAILADIGLRANARGRAVSSTTMSVLAMLFSAVLYLGLAFALGSVILG